MIITDVKIYNVRHDGNIKAIAAVTFDNDLIINGVKILQGSERLYVGVPTKKGPDGKYYNLIDLLGVKARKYFEKTVLSAYKTQTRKEMKTHGD